MIIVRIIGGLGNQLFIYAFSRALALRNNCELKFDLISGFQRDNFNRKLQLHNFNVRVKKASIYDSFYYPIRKRSAILSALLYPGCDYFTESDTKSFSKVDKERMITRKTFVEGYWQSPLYFLDFEDTIKDELKVISPHSLMNENILNEIKTCNSVAIHVRRVNYSRILPLEFYSKSIKLIVERVNDPIFFCFSDDINWCRENFNKDLRMRFVDNNAQNEIEDFWLMTNCKYFIASNSTFAWWASWLSSSKEKIIISPSPEFWSNTDTVINKLNL